MGACLGCRREDRSEKPIADIEMDRGCTDVPWLLLYIAWWGAVWVVLGIALDGGANIDNLFTKVDYKGDRCGISANEATNEVGMWLTANSDVESLFLCIETCDDAITPLYRVLNSSSEFIGQCLPGLDVVQDALPTGNSQSMSAAMNDVRESVGLIAAGAGVAIVASFLYTWFLSGFAGCLVWTAIFGTIAGTAFVAWTFFQTASDLAATGENPNQELAAQVISYTLIVAIVIFICVIIFLRNRIQIAVQVVKEASAAISDIKSLVIFPTIPLVIGIGYFAFWIWGALLIFSVEVEVPVEIAADARLEIQRNFIVQTENLTDILDIGTIDVDQFPNTPTFANYTQFEFDPEIQNPFAVYFFHLLWTVQFLIYMTFATVAGAVAEWYFSASDKDGEKIVGSEPGQLSHTPVSGSFKRVLRYHLGTVFFGAFIIAVIQFVRAVVKYIEEKSKAKTNTLQRAIFCLIQCCLKCLECCMDQMSQNAFIWNAIYGEAFCPSAFSSFSLIWRNLARVAAINLVSSYLLVIGKVVVTVFSGGFVGLIITNAEPYKTDVSSAVFPVLLTMFLAYLVASLFMVVYDTTIDTIFLCFLVDEEVNKGTGNMRARPSLVKLIDDHAVESQDIADKDKLGKSRGMATADVSLADQ